MRAYLSTCFSINCMIFKAIRCGILKMHRILAANTYVQTSNNFAFLYQFFWLSLIQFIKVYAFSCFFFLKFHLSFSLCEVIPLNCVRLKASNYLLNLQNLQWKCDQLPRLFGIIWNISSIWAISFINTKLKKI